MKKLALFLLTISCLAMGMNSGLAKLKAMVFQQKVFTISYLELDSNFFVLKNEAFKHTHELNSGLDSSTMHYFEAKMRELQGNGSQYLQTIKQEIQKSIVRLGDRNTQRPIMENHIKLIDKVLSGPDIKKIDGYLAIKALAQEGKVDQATILLDAYKRAHGDTGSSAELDIYISSMDSPQGDVHQFQSTHQDKDINIDDNVSQNQSGLVSTYKNRDMKIGELPQDQLGEKFSHILSIFHGGDRGSAVPPIYHNNDNHGGVPNIPLNAGNTSTHYPHRSVQHVPEAYQVLYDAGDINGLQAKLKECAKDEKNQLKCLLETPVMKLLKTVKERSLEEAKVAIQKIHAACQENLASPTPDPNNFTREHYQAAVELLRARGDYKGFISDIIETGDQRLIAQPVATNTAAAIVDLISTTEVKLPLNPQDQLVSDKSKTYGLDTAQDFRAVGNKILENCGFVLAALQNQLPGDVESIKTEFTFAIDHIKNAKSLEEFSYHLSVVDFRVAIAQYVQEYQSQDHYVDSQFRNGLLEKVNQSGQLLGRSIEQFAKRIKYTVTHPQEEIYARVMAPIHLAQMGLSISKIASQYGAELMSAEDKWGFVCQTWNTLADMCGQIKAEDFFDGLGVLAADIITQQGLTKLSRYLAKLELAVETIGKGQKLYQHIEKGVDKVLQRSPMPIPMQTKIPAADIINDLRKRGIYVPELSERTINTTRALKSHPLYYVIRRTYREINQSAPLYEGKYKGFDKCANKFIKFPFKHILAPEFQKNRKDFMASLHGWHHDYNNIIENSGLIELMNKEVGKNGVYRATVRWGDKMIEKTFYPSFWTTQNSIQKVCEAYKNFLDSGSSFILGIDGEYKIISKTNDNITIKMYFTAEGIMKTAYPIFEG